MKKEKSFLFITFLLSANLAVSIAVTGCSNKNDGAKIDEQTSSSNVQLVDVDKIAENPGAYSGNIKIIGNVNKVIAKNKIFTLSCEDGDATVSIAYDGALPKQGDKVEILGSVKKDSDGKYIFTAKELKINEN